MQIKGIAGHLEPESVTFFSTVEAHDSDWFISALTCFTIHSPILCAGKKNGDLDRNFDTLDLPKRSETAKGNVQICAYAFENN